MGKIKVMCSSAKNEHPNQKRLEILLIKSISKQNALAFLPFLFKLSDERGKKNMYKHPGESGPNTELNIFIGYVDIMHR